MHQCNSGCSVLTEDSMHAGWMSQESTLSLTFQLEENKLYLLSHNCQKSFNSICILNFAKISQGWENISSQKVKKQILFFQTDFCDLVTKHVLTRL